MFLKSSFKTNEIDFYWENKSLMTTEEREGQYT